MSSSAKDEHILIGGRVYVKPYHTSGTAYAGIGRVGGWWNRNAVNRFSRQLAMLLEADVSLPQSLALIGFQQRNVRWQRMLEQIEQRVQEGETLSQALAWFPRVFRPGFVLTIVWAEGNGDPNDLILALRLLAGDTDYRPARTAPQPEEADLDVFARRLRG